MMEKLIQNCQSLWIYSMSSRHPFWRKLKERAKYLLSMGKLALGGTTELGYLKMILGITLQIRPIKI